MINNQDISQTSRQGGLYCRPYRAAFFHDGDRKFSLLRNANVLIYWPHGFGDYIFLSYILPLMESSNRYWVCHFGDDTTCVMEGNNWVTPLYTGVQSPHCHHGGQFGLRHFRVEAGPAGGCEREFIFPMPLYNACVKNKIDVVLKAGFPEIWGHSSFPYHSKIRHSIRCLLTEGNLKNANLGSPIKNSISFSTEPWVTRWVEARLSSMTDYENRKLCLIARNGYTTIGKNWGHRWREDLPPDSRREGEECRDFMKLMLKSDRRWMFLILEDRMFEGQHTVRSLDLNAFSYAEVFGPVGQSTLPFGLILKALVNFADLAIGVPTGPFHLFMAKQELPTIGIWIVQQPSWYDEPKSACINVLSRNLKDAGLSSRPGSFDRRDGFEYKAMHVDTRVIFGEQVFNAVQKLLR